MPRYRTLCGIPPTEKTIALRVPNGLWRADTVITDTEGNEVFVLMEADKSMRGYEAVFGDLEGRKLCCVRRKLHRAPQQDGYYFCTYRPTIDGQPPLAERDCNNKSIYPFAYLEYAPLKGRYWYYLYNMDAEKDEMVLDPPTLVGDNPWLGFMMVCCTPFIRCGKWTLNYRKPDSRKSLVAIDQWKNLVEVHEGQDLLAALCMAYVLDKSQCQPMITVIGAMDPEYDNDEDSNGSLDSNASDYDSRMEKRSLVDGEEQIDFDSASQSTNQKSYPAAKPDAVPLSEALGHIELTQIV